VALAARARTYKYGSDVPVISMFVWLVLIYSERIVLRLFAGGWFVLREKYS
jgi:hypothetical protein